MRLNRMGWVGLALIALSVLTLGGWTAWFQTRTWCALDVPISLSQGSHLTTHQFDLNRAAQYEIEIGASGNIPADTLGCLLANGIRATCGDASVLRLNWALSNSGIVVQGSSDDTKGYGGEIGSTGEQLRTIGFFKGDKGQRYKLDVDVLNSDSRLAAAKSHLTVSIADTSFESGLVFSGLLRFGCVLLALAGAGMLAFSLARQSR
jgi:hypothetical protein